jgi:3-dehydroquinate dehydratase-2
LLSILVLNGPNLNRLGMREPHIYGSQTLSSIEHDLKRWGEEHHVRFAFFQSNHEGELIDQLHQAEHDHHGIVFNPGAFTHYSYALRDAIASISLPVIEVHISHVYQREAFRHQSVIAPVCLGQISGLGVLGYRLAAEALVEKLSTEGEEK